jgi:hypothetical protein
MPPKSCEKVLDKRLTAARRGYSHLMVAFRVIDPSGNVVATRDIDSAESAHAWFADSVAGSSETGWRIQVDDEGRWALFDDTEGIRLQR